MRDNIIISGSTDRTLKVWNAETGECIHTLYGHTSTVRCMHLHEKRYESSSAGSLLVLYSGIVSAFVVKESFQLKIVFSSKQNDIQFPSFIHLFHLSELSARLLEIIFLFMKIWKLWSDAASSMHQFFVTLNFRFWAKDFFFLFKCETSKRLDVDAKLCQQTVCLEVYIFICI